MKNIKVIVGIIILLVVVGSIFYFSKNSSEVASVVEDNTQSTTTSSVSKTTKVESKAVSVDLKKESNQYINKDGVYIIKYTDSGFSPKSLQVPKGKSIKFINSSSRGMRIFTSDNSDQKFVELNQPATVSNGGTYTFTITNSGLWNYYNQTYTAHTANILVY